MIKLKYIIVLILFCIIALMVQEEVLWAQVSTITNLSEVKWSINSAHVVKSGKLTNIIMNAFVEAKPGQELIVLWLDTGLKCPCKISGRFDSEMFTAVMPSSGASVKSSEVRSCAIAFALLSEVSKVKDENDMVPWLFAHKLIKYEEIMPYKDPLFIRVAFNIPVNIKGFELWEISSPPNRTLIGKVEIFR